MGNWSREFDKSHPVAANARFGDFYTAAFADNTPVAHPLVLTTMAFPVFSWPKDSFAEQPIHFGFERAIVNGFRFGDFTDHLTIGKGSLSPLPNSFWRGDCNFDVVKPLF